MGLRSELHRDPHDHVGAGWKRFLRGGRVGGTRPHTTPPGRERARDRDGDHERIAPPGTEREDVVAALMPFRGSYYEHFGYGFVERRTEWTVPLSIMPRGEFDTIRFFDAAKDREALEQCRKRVAQRGQCDIERSSARWERYLNVTDCGFLVIDRHGDGPVPRVDSLRARPQQPRRSGYGQDMVRPGYEDIATFKRFLYFLGSLHNQYTNATLQLPADLPLDLLLKEDADDPPHGPQSSNLRNAPVQSDADSRAWII